MHDYKLQPPQKTSSDTFSWLTSNSMRMIFTLCPPCDFIFHLCDFFESITSSQPFEWNAIDVTFHLNYISIVKKEAKTWFMSASLCEFFYCVFERTKRTGTFVHHKHVDDMHLRLSVTQFQINSNIFGCAALASEEKKWRTDNEGFLVLHSI